MKKTLALVAYDLKFSAREFHALRFIVIAVAVVIFMWSYSVRFHPLFYTFVLGFASLEGLYMNAFFRLPNELERMMLFPISWHRIIIAKAISTLVLTAPFLLLSGVLISYAAVGLPPVQILWDGLLLLLSVKSFRFSIQDENSSSILTKRPIFSFSLWLWPSLVCPILF
jgi:hypothetical protein